MKLHGFDCLIKFIHCMNSNKFNIVNNNDYFYNAIYFIALHCISFHFCFAKENKFTMWNEDISQLKHSTIYLLMPALVYSDALIIVYLTANNRKLRLSPLKWSTPISIWPFIFHTRPCQRQCDIFIFIRNVNRNSDNKSRSRI